MTGKVAVLVPLLHGVVDCDISADVVQTYAKAITGWPYLGKPQHDH